MAPFTLQKKETRMKIVDGGKEQVRYELGLQTSDWDGSHSNREGMARSY